MMVEKEFQELIRTRRSVRKFDPSKAIASEDITKILQAGVDAPSAKNQQPYSFYLLESAEARQKIQQCYDREWFADAAAYILVVGHEPKAWRYNDEDHSSSIYTDGAIATTHMMLQAWSMGIGSTWVCAFDRELCCKLFGLEWKEETPLNILALGYPAVDTTTLPFKRRPFEEVVRTL